MLVQTRSEMKATGLPMGAHIAYEDAPEFMQKRYDSFVNSKPSKECKESNAKAYITALKIRESVEQVNGKHARSNSNNGDMILTLIQAASFDGSKALPA